MRDPLVALTGPCMRPGGRADGRVGRWDPDLSLPYRRAALREAWGQVPAAPFARLLFCNLEWFRDKTEDL